MNFKLGMGLATIAIIALLASGCDKPAATTPAPAAPSGAAEMAPATEVVAASPATPAAIIQDSPIWFEPEALSSCAKDQEAVIHWNASMFPGVTTVKIATPSEEGEEAVFAVAGNVNQKEAGSWVRGGTVFIMRDNADDTELARAEYPTLPCKE